MWPLGPGPCFCRESAGTLVVSLPRDHNISGSAVSAHRLPDAALFRRRSARLRRRRWRRRAGNGGARCPAARTRLLLLQEICRTSSSPQMNLQSIRKRRILSNGLEAHKFRRERKHAARRAATYLTHCASASRRHPAVLNEGQRASRHDRIICPDITGKE